MKGPLKNLKIALVHDYLNQYGGGERVLEALCELYPDATVYTSIYDEKLMGSWLIIPKEKIKTNFISKLPFHNYLSKHYFFLYPLAFRLTNFSGADVILSSTSYAAKFATGDKNAIRICYIFTPPRFLWGYDTELQRYYVKAFDRFLHPLYQLIVPSVKKLLQHSDFNEAQKINYFISISREVQGRVKKNYGRNSLVIYPPVDLDRFKGENRKGEYFLIVSRLGGYKKVDIAVKAFNELGLALKIVGQGPQFNYLRSIAKKNVEICGRLSDAETNKLIRNCKALIFPTHEDFGIVPVEAMAAGKPVIAFRGGGVLETVVEGKTGLFFDEQSPESLIRTIQEFANMEFSEAECKRQAGKFSKEIFKKRIGEFVTKVIKERNTR